MTPFPAFHNAANSTADEHVTEARRIASESEEWLKALDDVLEHDALPVITPPPAPHHVHRPHSRQR